MAIDWKTLRQDSKYQQLSYEEQLQVNQALLRREYQNDPQFQKLNAAEKAGAISRLATRVPAFQNPDQDVRNKLQLAQRVEQGDQQAIEEATNEIAWNSFEDQLSIVDALETMGRGVVNFLNPNTDEYKQLRQRRMQRKKDHEKAMNYLEMKMLNDNETAKQAKTATTLGNIGGFVLDFASWWAATGPIAKGTKALVQASSIGQKTGMFAGKFAGAGGKAINSPGKRFFWQSFVPETARNTRAGFIGIARENINGTMEERLGEDPEWYEAAWENSKLFGEYFLGDMLFYSGIQAGKVMKGGISGLWKYGRPRGGKEMVDDSEFQNIVKGLTQRGGLTKEAIAELPQQQQQYLKSISLQVERAKNVKNLMERPQELAQYVLKGKGYDVRFNNQSNKWEIEDIMSGNVSSFDDFEGAIAKGLKDADMKMRPQTKDPEDVATQIGGSNQVSIEQYISASTSGLNINSKGMAKLLQADRVGNINPRNVKFTADRVLKQTGVEDDILKNVQVKRVDPEEYFQRGNTRSGNTINIPRKVDKPQREADFVRKFTKDLQEVAEENGGSFNRFRGLDEEILTAKRDLGFSPHWVDYAAENLASGRLKYENGTYKLYTPKGIEAQGSMEDVGRYLFKNYAFNQSRDSALTHTQKYLWKEHGMSLKQRENGQLALRRRADDGRMVTEHYDDLDQLFRSNPIYEPDLPVDAMPDINITNSAKGRFEIKSGVASGHPKLVRDFMDNFKDYKHFAEEVPIKMSEGNVASFNRKLRTYRVTHPETGVIYQNKSLDKVKEFLNKGTRKFDELDEHAKWKGARVHPFKGEYVIYQRGTEIPWIAKNKDEARRIIADELQTPQYVGKELTELSDEAISDLQREFRANLEDSAFEGSFQEVAHKIAKYGEKTGGQVKGRTAFLDLIAPKDVQMSRYAKEANMPEMYDYWKNLERGREAYEGAFNNFQKQLRRATGKLTREQDYRLGKVLQSEVPESQWAQQYKNLFEEDISQRELKVLERVRTILGRSEEEGLFATFGIDGYKFITNQFPRIRRMNLDDYKNLPPDAEGALKRVLGVQELPSEMKFFSENMRTDDLIHAQFEENLSEVLSLYARQGFRKKYMNKPFQEMKDWFYNLDSGSVPAAASNHIKAYLEEMIGMSSSPMQRSIEEGTRAMIHKIFKNMEKMGLMKDADKKVTDDIVSLANRFTIASMMSFKAWLPFRDALTPFLTLGPRVGNDVVWESMKKAAKNGEEIVGRLKAKGRIPDRSPVMKLTGAEGDMFIDKFNNVGMYAYQTTDAWTRAVSDQIADTLMRDTVKRWNRGAINEKEFLDLSEIDILDEFKQKEILDYLRQGNFEEAKDAFSFHLTWEGIFPYKAGTNPQLFQGQIGRIFGGFGHFPVYYTANVFRGLGKAPAKKKIRFARNAIGTSLALYNGFNQTLGMDPKEFLFYQPMNFSGGPYYDLINTAMESTNTDYYTGAIAREKLPSMIAQTFVPGSSAALNFWDGVKKLQQGDTHGFIFNALSAPVDENF